MNYDGNCARVVRLTAVCQVGVILTPPTKKTVWTQDGRYGTCFILPPIKATF